MPHSILWLNDNQVDKLLDPAAAYRSVRGAFECHARKDYQQPLKPYVRPLGREQEHQGGRFIAMPGFLGGPFQTAGLKWISGFPSNVERGLPRASGILVLNSTETGQPLAVLECGVLSARRTAAVAALAFDLLAPPGPQQVALLGAGPIARAVIEALDHGPERDIGEFRLYDLRRDRAESLAAELVDRIGRDIRIATSAEACVAGAGVIITATTGSRGYLRREWVSVGGLIVALSLDDCTPELFLAADKVVVDDYDQSNREDKLLHRLVKDGRFGRDRVHAELGEIITGSKPGREVPGRPSMSTRWAWPSRISQSESPSIVWPSHRASVRC